MKKEKKIKTLNDEIEVKLNAFELKHLMSLLEEEAMAEDVSTIKSAVRLYEKLKYVFDRYYVK